MFEITKDMLLSMKRNFDARVIGQDVIADLSHNPGEGGAATVTQVQLEENGNKLRGLFEFTPFGVDAVRNKGFVYLSPEYSDDYEQNEAPFNRFGATLTGVALTPRPVIKNQERIALSESQEDDTPTFFTDRITRILNEEKIVMKEFLKKLREALQAKNLAEAMITQLCETFEKAAEPLATDDLRRALMENFIVTGENLAKQLAELPAGSAAPVIQLSVAGPAGLDEAGVRKLLADQQAEQTRQLAETKQKRETLVGIFTKALADAKLEGLTDDERKELSAAADLITAEMTEDQVRKLAETQIALGNRMGANKKLASMGYRGPAGQVHITMDSSNEVKSLQEEVDKRLYDRMPAHRRYALSNGAPIEANKIIVEEALALYDQQNGRRLHEEYQAHKRLAAGDSLVSDVAVPAIFERTVVREALYQLVGLGLCDVGTDTFSTVAQIPYSYRDTGAAGASAARKYEGQPIARAAVKQALEEARPIPQKLAFEVSDELRYLVGNGQINFDIVAENARNAARIIGEDTETLIFDEHLNAADQYNAAAVTNEAVATADGTKTIFVLDNFPVVRPKKVYDLQGNQVGSTLYPITVTVNSVAIDEWAPGVSAGMYYVMNHNLGEISFVDETGALTAPTNTHAIVASYSYATNVYKWDSDLGSLAVADKYDEFLYRFGLRKTAIEDRAYMANVAAMSGTLRTQIEQAKQFGANFKRPGTDLMTDGNLGRIKDVPAFRSYAPGLAMGDVRTVIGERGTVRFRMLKPWTLGELENQKDSNGRFTGKKEAYGDQFVVVHTPTLLKGALTSMVVYSATARVDRAS
ncbi:MAG: hypothetical protein AB1450_08380 [Pseudomonadota bacterium]